MLIHIFLIVSLPALALAQDKTPCYEAINICRTDEYRAAFYKQDREQLCRTVPGYIECAEKKNQQCTDKEMAAKNKKSIDNLKLSLQNCPQNTSEASIMQKCVKMFSNCSTLELYNASERGNVEALNRLFPNVIKCMEEVLSKFCKTTPENDQHVQLLLKEVKRMKSAFLSLCPTNCNGSSWLMTSIAHTCLAVILIALLH